MTAFLAGNASKTAQVEHRKSVAKHTRWIKSDAQKKVPACGHFALKQLCCKSYNNFRRLYRGVELWLPTHWFPTTQQRLSFLVDFRRELFGAFTNEKECADHRPNPQHMAHVNRHAVGDRHGP